MSSHSTKPSVNLHDKPSYWQPSLNHWLTRLVERHRSPCKQGPWGRQVEEFRNSEGIVRLELTLRMSGRDKLIQRQLKSLLERIPIDQWRSLGEGYRKHKSLIYEGEKVMKKLGAAFKDVHSLIQCLSKSAGDENVVPDLDGKLRDWEDWLTAREGIREVQTMEQILEVIAKAVGRVMAMEGLNDVEHCPLQYFGEEWACMGRWPLTPPFSSRSSVLSRGIQLSQSVKEEGIVQVDVVVGLDQPEEATFCKINRTKEHEVVVQAFEKIGSMYESEEDEIFPLEPEVPPLAVSTPRASLGLNTSSNTQDSSTSSGSDWLLGNH